MLVKRLPLHSYLPLGFPVQLYILPCTGMRLIIKNPINIWGIFFFHMNLPRSIAAQALAPAQQKRWGRGRAAAHLSSLRADRKLSCFPL